MQHWFLMTPEVVPQLWLCFLVALEVTAPSYAVLPPLGSHVVLVGWQVLVYVVMEFSTNYANSLFFFLSYARCFCWFSCSEVCAGLGNGCERLCTSRSLLGSYVHQESI